MNCSKCNKPKPIINKKHWLCMDCNFERLHKGVSRVEIYKERAKDRVEFKTPRIVRTKINQQTSKEKTIKKELSEIKKSIDQEAIENGTYFCQGCGKSNGLLDKSHILSVGQRKDLELDKENMNLFCRECHTNYESGNMEKMIILNSFEKKCCIEILCI